MQMNKRKLERDSLEWNLHTDLSSVKSKGNLEMLFFDIMWRGVVMSEVNMSEQTRRATQSRSNQSLLTVRKLNFHISSSNHFRASLLC